MDFMKKKTLSFCLVLLLFSIGAVSLVADEEQGTWWNQKQTVTPKDNGAYEVETTVSQCFYVENFKVDEETKKNRSGKVTKVTTTVTNPTSYTAKAYINGTLTTFTAGQARTYDGKVSVQPCL
jgi:hypothetical protein